MSSNAPSTDQKQDSAQGSTNNIELLAKLNALDRVQAVIEFSLNGDILHANDNFLSLFGYSLAELTGKPHRILWKNLQREYLCAELLKDAHYGAAVPCCRTVRRLAKNGSHVWIEAKLQPQSWTSTASRQDHQICH